MSAPKQVHAIFPSNDLSDADQFWLTEFQQRTNTQLLPIAIDDDIFLKQFVKGKNPENGWPAFKEGTKHRGWPNDTAIAEITAFRAGLKEPYYLAMGHLAFYMATSKSPYGNYRGTWVDFGNGQKILPTYFLDELYEGWYNHWTFEKDVIKAAAGPKPRLNRTFIIAPSWPELVAFETEIKNAKILSLDIETANDKITCVGFSVDKTKAICIPFIKGGAPYWSPYMEPKVWSLIRKWLSFGQRILAQNCTYEYMWLLREALRIAPDRFEDTMLLYHSISPELPRSLDFMASIETNEFAWKNMVSFKKSEEIEND